MAEPKTIVLIPHSENATVWYESREVIRCRDCANFIRDIKACQHLHCSANPEGFCSDGERREESDE